MATWQLENRVIFMFYKKAHFCLQDYIWEVSSIVTQDVDRRPLSGEKLARHRGIRIAPSHRLSEVDSASREAWRLSEERRGERITENETPATLGFVFA